MEGSQVDGTDGADGSEVELEHRPKAEHTDDKLAHRAVVGTHPGVGFLFLQHGLSFLLQVGVSGEYFLFFCQRTHLKF